MKRKILTDKVKCDAVGRSLIQGEALITFRRVQQQLLRSQIELISEMVTEESVREALKQVEDPEIGLNIVDLGLVYEIELEEDVVHVKMTLTSPGCPVGPQILNGSKMVIEQLEGVQEAEIELVWEPFWTPERINPDYRAALGL